MVSVMTSLVAIIFGMMLYIGLPVAAMSAPVELRKKIGTFYYKMGARALKQFTLVRRVLSGYDVIPITVDDEQKLLKATLSSSTLGEDNEYRYADPDGRVMRLFGKPIAIAYEEVPAAVDAEMSEWGYWTQQKADGEGLWNGDVGKEGGVEVDPYVEVSSNLRLVDPVDVFNLVPNDVDPENIKTTEKLTKDRFSKYGEGVGLKESLRVIISFAVGAGGVIAMRYVEQNMIGESGGGLDSVANETLGMVNVDPAVFMDMVTVIA